MDESCRGRGRVELGGGRVELNQNPKSENKKTPKESRIRMGVRVGVDEANHAGLGRRATCGATRKREMGGGDGEGGGRDREREREREGEVWREGWRRESA